MGEQTNPDLEKMCRLCLRLLNEEELVSIFAQSGSIGGGDGNTTTMQMSIPMRIMACAALEVQTGDGLPKAICHECRYQLEKSYYFRKRSQLSDSKLRKHIRLTNLGKKSRVFQKKDDEDEFEEELEFEDSIQFIQKREEEKQAEIMAQCQQTLENDFEQKLQIAKSDWMEQYKAELKDEVSNELRSSVVAEVKKELRAEIAEEIRTALRDECTQQAKEELRTEVTEECREKERVALLDELQLFLNQKKVEQKTVKPNNAVVATMAAKIIDIQEAVSAGVELAPASTSTHEMVEKEDMCVESQAEGDDEEEPEFYLIEPMRTQPEQEETIKTGTKSPKKRPKVAHSQRFEYFEDKMGTANFRLTASESSSQEPGAESYHIADTGEVQYYQQKNTSNSNYEDDQEMENGEEIEEDEDDVAIVFNLADDLDEQVELLEELKTKQSSKSQPNSTEDCKSEDKLLFTTNVPAETIESDTDGTLPVVQVRKTNTPKTFKCNSCPMVFSTITAMERHQRSTHEKVYERGGFTYQCEVCHVYLSCNSALKRHMIIHSGLKPHACEHCGKSFVQREVLKRHMLTHTGAKPHKCTQCPRTFTHKYSLVNHVQRIHSEVPVGQQHACHLCPKRFSHKSGLSRHLVSHTGLTYQCLECKRNFGDRSSVRRHVANVHGDRVRKESRDSIKGTDIEFLAVEDDYIIVANEENSTEYI